ncbi:MAG: patatin-like phospholipase family protein, partial [Alcaligenaceae bacterium]|nr:patatin-like phospholipase family protein [Alcaligenaceae bacterium]
AGLSLPGVMPPVARDDALYLDTAFVQDANLMAAVRAGAEELWVLWCLGNTDQYLGGPLRIYVQMLEMAAHGSLHRDLQDISDLNARINAGDSPYGQSRPIRVHLIHPQCPLPLDPNLYLGRVSAADLIARGYRDMNDYLQNANPDGMPLDPSITSMQSPKAGIRFRETMRGPFSLGQTDPKAGAAAGKQAGTELIMHAGIYIEDIERFVSDPQHAGLIHGEIDFSPIGLGLSCLSGKFNLFNPARQPGMKRMVYELGFRHADQDYYLAGYKDVHNNRGFDLWSDTTTLYTCLHQGTDQTGTVIGAGVLRLGVVELLKLASTLRATDADGIRGKWRAITRFGGFFVGELKDSYGPGAS